MNLKFLNNPSQRIATGKSLPLKQLEAIVVYGTAEQRAKVVAKVLPQAYTLSLHKSTYHILTTILTHCDNLIRAQLLYNLRRKINDMARSACGNVIVQQLLEYLPNAQRREIAQAFVLNVEEEELELLCKHGFGNHVAQKMLEYPASSEVIVDHLKEKIRMLATHQFGQRIVAKLVEAVEGGAALVTDALFPSTTDDDMSSLEDVFNAVDESLVVSALLKHPSVDASIKDGIIAFLLEHADEFTALEKKVPSDVKETLKKPTASYPEPDFITKVQDQTPKGKKVSGDDDVDGKMDNARAENNKVNYRHNFAFATAIEYGDDTQRQALFDALKARLPQFVATKGQIMIAQALFKFAGGAVPSIRTECLNALFAKPQGTTSVALTPSGNSAVKKGKKQSAPVVEECNPSDVALHPVKSLLLRSFIEIDAAPLGSRATQIAKDALALATSPVGGPVLQKLVESSTDDIRSIIFAEVEESVAQLCQDACGSFLVQSLLEYSTGELKQAVIDATVDALIADPHVALSTAQGSRVMQKLVAYANDETVKEFADAIVEGEVDGDDEADEDDEEDDADDDEEQAEKEGDAEEGVENKKEEANADEEVDQSTLSRKQIREINRNKHYKIRDRRVLSYAVHNHACFAIQALLRELKSRQLNDQRKSLMNCLKPFVFDLAVSPWAGRIVLDTMIHCGTADLKSAIKNVVFLKAEHWLSEVPGHKKGQAGMDPTMRHTLRRNRDESKPDGGDNQKKARTEAAPEVAAPAKKPQKKLFRSMKK